MPEPAGTPAIHHPASPPWLWLLTLTGGLNPIGMFILLCVLLAQQFAQIAAFTREHGSMPGLLFALVYLPLMFFSIVLPSLAIGLGSWVLFFPGVRGRWVEKRYSLSPLADDAPLAGEIKGFAEQHVPGIEITANLLRSNQIAFVYPVGRRGRLAIFGGLLRLWQRDPQLARAALVHELAHYRRGDPLYLGAGSALELSIWLASCSLLLGLLLWIVLGLLDAAMAAWILIGGMLTLTGLAMIIAATWCAEFAADYSSALYMGGGEPLLRLLELHDERRKGWSSLLARLTHPPLAMRRALLRMSPRRSLFWQNMVFPLALLAKDVVVTGSLIMAALILGDGFREQMKFADGSSITYSAALSFALVINASLMILLWPRLYPRFAGFWLGQRCQSVRVPPAPYRRAALVCSLACLVSLIAAISAHESLGLSRKVDMEKLNRFLETQYVNPDFSLPPGVLTDPLVEMPQIDDAYPQEPEPSDSMVWDYFEGGEIAPDEDSSEYSSDTYAEPEEDSDGWAF